MPLHSSGWTPGLPGGSLSVLDVGSGGGGGMGSEGGDWGGQVGDSASYPTGYAVLSWHLLI